MAKYQYIGFALITAASTLMACGDDDDDTFVPWPDSGDTTGDMTDEFDAGMVDDAGTTGNGDPGDAGTMEDAAMMEDAGMVEDTGTGGMWDAAADAGMDAMPDASGDAAVTDSGIMPLTDDQILHVTRTANMGEVEQGEIALERAEAQQVIDFAQMMVDQHTAALEEAQTLAEEESLTPAANAVSALLEQQSSALVVQLEEVEDEEFDLLYMNAQVNLHEQVLQMLDDELIPQAENTVLESYLMTLRADVADHLETAQSIVEDLSE